MLEDHRDGYHRSALRVYVEQVGSRHAILRVSFEHVADRHAMRRTLNDRYVQSFFLVISFQLRRVIACELELVKPF